MILMHFNIVEVFMITTVSAAIFIVAVIVTTAHGAIMPEDVLSVPEKIRTPQHGEHGDKEIQHNTPAPVLFVLL